MATATRGTFGYSGSLGSTISARSRREPKYSKQKQTRMIRAILSRRMMSPPSYEDVLDYVDSQVTYAENKREVLAIFGERSRKGRMITDKDMKDMYCDSLHNQCVSNGLETCQTACAECKTPAACDKAKQIKKEIKKHGRKLTHFERMEAERTKEAKRKVKKPKYSTGQIVKCREGYELQCGFSGVRKITQVKAYPDYVMYGIKGKAQGFVEEDWIVGVEGKISKPVLKEKKKVVIITVSCVPKLTTMQNINRNIASNLTDKQLILQYAKIVATRRADVRGLLGGDWYNTVADFGGVTGRTPKDAWLLTNLSWQETEFKKEIKKRKLEDTFSLFVELQKAKPSTKVVKTTKPSKPRPTKVTKLTKKKKRGVIKGKLTTQKVSYKKKKLPKMPEAIKKVLRPKTLTKNQQVLLRKYRFVDVSIQGKMYHVTKQNVKDGKVEWYKKNGKVCLKNKR